MPWIQIVVDALLDHRCPGSAVVALGTWPGAIVAAEAAAPFPLPSSPSSNRTLNLVPNTLLHNGCGEGARTLRSLRETNRAYVVSLVVQVAEDGSRSWECPEACRLTRAQCTS